MGLRYDAARNALNGAVIQPGALADVVIWDAERTETLQNADVISRAGYTVYEGWEVTGRPVMTIRRGEVVYEDGEILGQPGTGKLLARDPWQPPGV